MGRADRAQKRYDEIVKGQAAFSAKNADMFKTAAGYREGDMVSRTNGRITVTMESTKRGAKRGERAARAIERLVDAQGKRDAKNARKKKKGK